METIAQYAGIIWVGIILICIVWTFGTYIIGSMDRPEKRNKNMGD